MCLGPPTRVFYEFRQNPTLAGYVEKLVIPKLFWHSYNKQFPDDRLPGYGHGDRGISEFRKEGDIIAVYSDIFQLNRIDAVLQFLKLLSLDSHSDRIMCPCGSSKELRLCHGDILKTLAKMPYLETTHVAQDYWFLYEKTREARRKRSRRTR